MRALSVRQPWAWAIIHGQKDVENRVTGIVGGYRGPVAIHAPVTEDTRAFGDPLIRDVLERMKAKAAADSLDDALDLQRHLRLRGVFLGVADIYDEHTEDVCSRWIRGGRCSEWAQSGEKIGRTMHHIVLTNPRPFRQEIPWPGRLGLWTPPDHMIDRLKEAA